MRVSVYPKLVASGKMTKTTADEETRLMQLAAACFDKILKGKAPEEIQQSLFDIQQYQPRNSNNGAY